MLRYAEAHYSGGGRSSREETAISSSVLGMFMFIFVEVMFFGGLISAYVISIADVTQWPPAGQPRLPVASTAFNTLVLLASGWVFYKAAKIFEVEGASAKSHKWLLAGLAMGTFFIVFQGGEWVRLVSYGLTMTSSSYGSFFYLLIGAHALHAFGAILALGRVYWLMRQGRLQRGSYRAGLAFWYFVVGMWPILYVLVYLR